MFLYFLLSPSPCLCLLTALHCTALKDMKDDVLFIFRAFILFYLGEGPGALELVIQLSSDTYFGYTH